jgi:two-component system cell cycle sensor histidine kinase/response regulator CckA
MDSPPPGTGPGNDSLAGVLAVLEGAADAFVACDPEFHIVLLNAAAERLFDKSKARLLGATPWEQFSDGEESELELASRLVMAERAAATFEYRHQNRGLWLAVRIVPTAGGGIALWFHDITGSKWMAEKLAETEGALALRSAELDSIYAEAPMGLALLDSGLRHVRVNWRLAQMNGLSPEEHLGRTIREALPELASLVEPLCLRVIETGIPVTDVELRNSTAAQPDIERYWLASHYPVKTGEQIIGVNVVVQEITHRKLCESALRDKTDELNEAQRVAGVGSWILDLETGTVTRSNELHRLTGGDSGNPILSFNDLERIHTPESWVRLQAAVQRARLDGIPYEIQAEAVLPNGEHRWRIIRGEAVRDASGRIVKLRGTAQDITDRKRAEQELRMAHTELAAIHAHAPMIFLVVDRDFRVRRVNEAATQFAGRPEAEMLGLRTGDAIGCLNSGKDSRSCGCEPTCGNCTLRTAVLDSIANRTRHDNVEAWLPVPGEHGIEERCFLVFTAPLELTGATEALVCALDITARKQAEKALRDSEYWLKESQRISRIGTYVFNYETGNWTSSRTLDEIFGIDAAYPRTIEGWKALIQPEQREEVGAHLTDDVLGQEKKFDCEYRIVRPSDGQVRWVHGRGAVVKDSGAATTLAGTVQDVTDRRAVEEQLRQSQKLEGLGRLAGGIAHDFNNLLTVINGYADMLLGEVKDPDPLRDSVAEIRLAGGRALDLTRQLLTFSRKQIVESQPLDLNRIIGQHLGMLQRLVGEDIEIETQLAPSLGRVLADPGQMHQVLLNLVVNARDAMPRGGKVTIATSDAQAEDPPSVLLSVADTGTGIDADAKEHIFDPFFTTKDKGSGTGLGLATVYAIVQQARGSISFQSESGRGTTFRIQLPRTEAAALEENELATLRFDSSGRETVLVVEDQDSVRKLTVQMLRRHGYRTLEAAQGDEALQLAGSYDGPIHLLLTDVVMPHMTGRELAERLTQVRPATKVLYMSGYAEDVIASRGLLEPGLRHIAKPFPRSRWRRKCAKHSYPDSATASLTKMRARHTFAISNVRVPLAHER